MVNVSRVSVGALMSEFDISFQKKGDQTKKSGQKKQQKMK